VDTPDTASAVHPPDAAPAVLPGERLNSNCFCTSLDGNALKQALSTELGEPAVFELVAQRCPFLFSSRPIYIADSQTQRMAEVIGAIESVVAMPAYRAQVLAGAPAIARHHPGGAKGVFFGYDFHLRGDRLGLIEINTNAGGALLNAAMARAHRACCLSDAKLLLAARSGPALERAIVDMFLAEWRLSDRGRALCTIAIVDAQPGEQYLYPEFLLFQRLFERHGLHAVIADPSALAFHDGQLWHGELAIDLVYNRLTDFMLDSAPCAALRAAYLAHAVVLTPHPQAHALFADKRNLAILSDPKQLQLLAVPVRVQEILLANIPRTEIVDRAHADRLWAARRGLFFKPTAGYGGRAAYRGDKITKRVWEEVLAGDYVAQAIVAPGERVSGTSDEPVALKFDLRCYAYDGIVQWQAARIYQGQTTNFRTPGGGFAPVYSLSEQDFAEGIDAMARYSGCANQCFNAACT
jgi:hypothetical protein